MNESIESHQPGVKVRVCSAKIDGIEGYILYVKSDDPLANKEKQYVIKMPDYQIEEMTSHNVKDISQEPVAGTKRDVENVNFDEFVDNIAQYVDENLQELLAADYAEKRGVIIEVFKPSPNNIMRDVRVIKIENRLNEREFDYVLVKVPDYNIIGVRQDLPLDFTRVENVDGAGDRIRVVYDHQAFANVDPNNDQQLQQNLDGILGNDQGSLREGMEAHSVNMRVYNAPGKKDKYIIEVSNLEDPPQSKYYRVDSQHYEERPVELKPTEVNINNLGPPLVQTATTEFGVSFQNFRNTHLQDLIAQQNHPIRKAIDRHGVRVTVHQEQGTERYIVCVTNLADPREEMQYTVDPHNNYYVQKIEDHTKVSRDQLGWSLPGGDVVKNKLRVADFGVSDIQRLASKETSQLRRAIDHHGVAQKVYKELNSDNYILCITNLADSRDQKQYEIDQTNNYQTTLLQNQNRIPINQLGKEIYSSQQLGIAYANFGDQEVAALVGQQDLPMRQAIEEHGVSVEMCKLLKSPYYFVRVRNLASNSNDVKYFEIDPRNFDIPPREYSAYEVLAFGTNLVTISDRPAESDGPAKIRGIRYADYGVQQIQNLLQEEERNRINGDRVGVNVYKELNSENYVVGISNFSEPDNITYYRIGSTNNYAAGPMRIDDDDLRLSDPLFRELQPWNSYRYEEVQVAQVKKLVENTNLRELIDSDRAQLRVYRDPKNKNLNHASYIVDIRNFSTPPEVKQFRINLSDYTITDIEPIKVMDIGKLHLVDLKIENSFTLSGFKDFNKVALQHLYENNNTVNNAVNADRVKLDLYKEKDSPNYIVVISNYELLATDNQKLYRISPPDYTAKSIGEEFDLDEMATSLPPASLEIKHGVGYESFDEDKLNALLGKPKHPIRQAIDKHAVQLNIHKALNEPYYVARIENLESPPKKKYCIIPITSDGKFDQNNFSILNSKEFKERKLKLGGPLLAKERVRNNFPNFSQKETKCQSNVSKSYGSYSEHVPKSQVQNNTVGYNNFGEAQIRDLVSQENTPIRQAIDKDRVWFNIYPDPDDRAKNNPTKYILSVRNFETPDYKEKQFSIDTAHPNYPGRYFVKEIPPNALKDLSKQHALLERHYVPEATVGFKDLDKKGIKQSSINGDIYNAINKHGVEITALYKEAEGKTCILEVTDIKDGTKTKYSINYSNPNAMKAMPCANDYQVPGKDLLLPEHKMRYRINSDKFDAGKLESLLTDSNSLLRKRVDLYTKASITIGEEGYFLALPNGGLAFAPKKPNGSKSEDGDYQWIGSWESGYNESTSAMQVNFYYNKGIPTESVIEVISRARGDSRLLDPFEGRYGAAQNLTNFVTEKDLKEFSSLSEAQNERNYYYLFYTNGMAVRVENGKHLKVGTWEPQYDENGRPLLHINYDNPPKLLDQKDVESAQSISFIDESLGKTPKDNFYDFKGREGKIWEFIQASKKPVEPEFELGMRNSESKTFIENLKKMETWKETTEKTKESDVYKLVYHDKKKEKNEPPVELEYKNGVISTPRGKKVTSRDVDKALDAMFVQIDSQIKAGKSPDKVGELVIYHRDPHKAEEIQEEFEERFATKYSTTPPRVIIVNSIEEFDKKMAGKTSNKPDQPQEDGEEEHGRHYGMKG